MQGDMQVYTLAPPDPLPVANGSVAFCAWSYERLAKGLNDLKNVRIQLLPNHQLRYEYWKTGERVHGWSLNKNASAMKYAGLKETFTHVHRFVACDPNCYPLLPGSELLFTGQDLLALHVGPNPEVRKLAGFCAGKTSSVVATDWSTVALEVPNAMKMLSSMFA